MRVDTQDRKWYKWLQEHRACVVGLRWLRQHKFKTMQEWWDACQRGDWMGWVHDMIPVGLGRASPKRALFQTTWGAQHRGLRDLLRRGPMSFATYTRLRDSEYASLIRKYWPKAPKLPRR